MNNRIKELAEQAGIPVIDSRWDYNDRDVLVEDNGEFRKAEPAEIISTLFDCERNMQKFAELIVKECAEVCRRQQYYDADDEHKRGVNSGSYTCMDAIKRNFGVEE